MVVATDCLLSDRSSSSSASAGVLQSSVLNKVGQIAASPHLRLILGQVAPRLDLSFTMNNQRILIANLAKGTIGEQAANLLGSLLVSHLQLIAMERGTLPPEQRVPFFGHIDEFQTLQVGRLCILAVRGEEVRAAFLSREPVHAPALARRAIRGDRERGARRRPGKTWPAAPALPLSAKIR
jgi:hypothetical protein